MRTYANWNIIGSEKMTQEKFVNHIYYINQIVYLDANVRATVCDVYFCYVKSNCVMDANFRATIMRAFQSDESVKFGSEFARFFGLYNLFSVNVFMIKFY